MSKNSLKGASDEPAKLDGLGVKEYTEGLAKFIQNCVTPMTIAIQGDWGTGKTSIMEMVKNRLPSDTVETLMFNTWQFSQLEPGNSLPLILMQRLQKAVGLSLDESTVEDDTPTKKVKKALTSDNTVNLGNLVVDALIGRFSNGATTLTSFLSDKELDEHINKIDNIKKNFQNAVNKKLEKKGEGARFVIFIDDLDRLKPEKAVELLEIMKNFFDCEKCVFVLAIDYNVVVRGVKSKYGDDFDEDKGRQFFDKIIQVPFRVPVERYEIGAYIIECFRQIGITIDAAQTEKYQAITKISVGNNPRAIKRLVNQYLLHNMIVTSNGKKVPDPLLFFAVLCMQSKFIDAYNILSAQIKNNSDKSEENQKCLEEAIDELLQDTEDERQVEFIAYFKSLLTNGEKYNSNEMKELCVILGTSDMVLASSSEPSYVFDQVGKSWLPEEDQQLINEFISKKNENGEVSREDIKEFARIHRRKEGGITSRLKKHGLID